MLTGKIFKNFDKLELNQHNAIIEKLSDGGKLANLLTNEEMDNVAEYFVRLPSELAMNLFKKVCAASEQNGTAMHGRQTSKGKVSEVMVKMLTPVK